MKSQREEAKTRANGEKPSWRYQTPPKVEELSKKVVLVLEFKQGKRVLNYTVMITNSMPNH